MTFLSNKAGQFTYFSLQLALWDWRGKDVLDFGGNVGNILREPASTIDAERYWCIDVDQEAIEIGQRWSPRSHWLFYDRYCFFFNPSGIPKLRLPRSSQTFDYILAYSVFTNTLVSDMQEIVGDLLAMLKPGGSLAFTFIDPHHLSWPGIYRGDNLLWRLEREQNLHPEIAIDVAAVVSKVRGARWFVLVNGTDVYVETEELPVYPPEQQRTCHAFHVPEFVQTLFPSAHVMQPVNREMQHCCVITN